MRGGGGEGKRRGEGKERKGEGGGRGEGKRRGERKERKGG